MSLPNLQGSATLHEYNTFFLILNLLFRCLGVAFILGICLMLFGLMACIFCIFLNWQFLYIVYAVLGALLCMFYLAIDIQVCYTSMLSNSKSSVVSAYHGWSSCRNFSRRVHFRSNSCLCRYSWNVLEYFGSCWKCLKQ